MMLKTRSDSVFLTAPDIDEPTLIGGDIAIKPGADRNADPCTSRGCMWGKWTDGKVYVPYYIANHYCEYFFLNHGTGQCQVIQCLCLWTTIHLYTDLLL